MKQIYALCSAVLMVGAPPVCAHEGADEEGFRASFGAGQARVDEQYGSDQATLLRGAIGYTWGGVGVEVGGMRSTKDFEARRNFGPDAPLVKTRVGASGVTLGMNVRSQLGDNWYMSARAGVLLWDVEVQAALCNAECAQSQRGRLDGSDFYAGGGLGYDFSQRYGVSLSYELYRVSLHHGQLSEIGYEGVPPGESHDLDMDVQALMLSSEFRF